MLSLRPICVTYTVCAENINRPKWLLPGNMIYIFPTPFRGILVIMYF